MNLSKEEFIALIEESSVELYRSEWESLGEVFDAKEAKMRLEENEAIEGVE